MAQGGEADGTKRRTRRRRMGELGKTSQAYVSELSKNSKETPSQEVRNHKEFVLSLK